MGFIWVFQYESFSFNQSIITNFYLTKKCIFLTNSAGPDQAVKKKQPDQVLSYLHHLVALTLWSNFRVFTINLEEVPKFRKITSIVLSVIHTFGTANEQFSLARVLENAEFRVFDANLWFGTGKFSYRGF